MDGGVVPVTPSVRILATGGTIASTDGTAGATPTLSGEELVDRLPNERSDIEVSVQQVSHELSFAIDQDVIAEIGRQARNSVTAGTDGIVVIHGTDTMAVSAYYLDLALDAEVPIVFTGAQRRPDEASADGPANLQTAIAAAAHEDLHANGGVYVAFNEELHAARDVVKAHTHKLEAFRSPGAGPVATFDRNGVRFHRRPGSQSESIPILETDRTVDVVASGVGVSGAQLRRRVEEVDGIVLEGTGLGNVTPALASAVDEALDRGLPIVLTSRCHAGAVSGVYGTQGGGKRLLEKGVLPAGHLPAWKARIKLMLALEAVEESGSVAAYF